MDGIKPMALGLILLGLMIAAAGALLYASSSVFPTAFGKLPGDIRIERPGFRFYFPIATCVIISIVLTLILTLIARFR